MSVSETQLLDVGARVNACKKLVKELEQSPARFTVQGEADLRAARSRLRHAQRELKQVRQAGQLSLFGGAE